MPKMLGKQPGLKLCCFYCPQRKNRNRNTNKRFVRLMKRRERQLVKKEVRHVVR